LKFPLQETNDLVAAQTLLKDMALVIWKNKKTRLSTIFLFLRSEEKENYPLNFT
jgi:hypothetical protein